MKKEKLRKHAITGLCGLFTILFIYAAGSKLREFDLFRAQIGQSPMLTIWADVIVIVVPALELIIALLLNISKYRLIGLYSFFTMMVMFTAYIFLITHYADFVPCSCGGILSKMTWAIHFRFNLLFVGLSAVTIMLYPSKIISAKENSEGFALNITNAAI